MNLEPAAKTKPATLWRHRDFLKLWVGESISVFGSQFTGIALPIIATDLGATTLQFGILNALGTAPFLMFGLIVGVWVDRWPRKPILIVGDVGRGFIVLGIAFLFTAKILGFIHLYVAAFFTGTLTVFFDVAYQSYVPSLVTSDQLVDANGKLETTRAASQVAGPGIGAILVSVFTAAVAMILDALTFFVSVAALLTIRRKEVPPEKKRTPMIADVREGLGVVFGDRRLRAIAGCTATSNFFFSALGAAFIPFLFVTLGYNTKTSLGAVLGLTAALGSIGALVGAVVAGKIGKRIGVGNAIILGSVMFVLSPGLFVLAAQPYAVVLLTLGQFTALFGALVYNVNQVSFRQAITPNRLQGRMNATMRFLVWGTLPLGALTGGFLGTIVGIRETLAFALAGASTAVFWILLSPVPAVKTIPAPVKE